MSQSRTQTRIEPGTSVGSLPGVGPSVARRLGRLGIATAADLLRHLPLRYEHESPEQPIGELTRDTIGAARGTVASTRWVPGHRGGRKARFEAVLQDETGRLMLVWFNAGYLRDRIHAGHTLLAQGKVGNYQNNPQMINPRWQVLDADASAPLKQETIRPVYPATEDLSTHYIARLVSSILEPVLANVQDPVPAELLAHHNMPALADAFRMAHAPEHADEPPAARRRLAYNELLLLQLGIAMKRAQVQHTLHAPPLKHNDAIDQHIRQRFPFALTDAQQRVVGEIAGDLTRDRPMNRLLQGDVGSGKTVVALYAMLMAVANQKQAVLMAPTELLAEQHYLSISDMLRGSQVRLALLTGSQPAPSSTHRRELLARIRAGQIDVIVGTHALLSQQVRFHELAVAVIDEQHRFGVQQRAGFRDRHGDERDQPDQPQTVPHHLVMTATPIPRTLSLTVFGDLDVSTIDQLPPGRTPVVNRVVEPEKAEQVYDYMHQRVQRGEQAYVLVPMVDEAGHETREQLKSVRAHARALQDRFGPQIRVAAVHGKLKQRTRENIMHRFRQGKIDVLVATTVIEVGVDVPNATMMVIEHADRFGLAQLHQLRGRVGRASDGRQSICAFIAQPRTDDARQRLEAIASTNDGFRIAERDLLIRGMGDFFGTRQSGLPPLRVASIPDDMELLMLARRDAQQLVDQDPQLARPEHAPLRKKLMLSFGDALGLIDVG